MRKTKLLTCVSALLLILSVGGCNETGDETDTGTSDSTQSINGPQSIIDKIHQNCNYTLMLQYDFYRSSKTITYADYQSGNYDLDEVNDTIDLDFSTITYLLYTENTLEMEYFELEGDTYEYQSSTIYVNDNGTCWQYIYPYNDAWNYYYGSGTWQDYCYSLDTFYSYGVGNYFTYDSLTSFDGIECEGYTYSERYAPYLFLSIGTDLLYGQTEAEDEANNFTHYLTYYIAQYQEMIINFNYKDKWFYEGDLTDNTILFRGDYEIYADIYNVGSTNDSYAYYIHDALQSQM